MAQTLLSGNNGKIEIGGTAVAAVKNFTIDIKSDTIETTTMGVDTRTYVKGMASWSGSADVIVDFDSTTGNLTGTAVISALNGTAGVVGGSTATITVYIDQVGAPSGKKWAGGIVVTGFSQKSAMDGLVEGTVSFQGSGPIAYSA
jgi:sporulation protein YlmC with PRC-barrel domain